jgi:hypothetical protein
MNRFSLLNNERTIFGSPLRELNSPTLEKQKIESKAEKKNIVF